jgi:hypothetical protein
MTAGLGNRSRFVPWIARTACSVRTYRCNFLCANQGEEVGRSTEPATGDWVNRPYLMPEVAGSTLLRRLGAVPRSARNENPRARGTNPGRERFRRRYENRDRSKNKRGHEWPRF